MSCFLAFDILLEIRIWKLEICLIVMWFMDIVSIKLI